MEDFNVFKFWESVTVYEVAGVLLGVAGGYGVMFVAFLLIGGEW